LAVFILGSAYRRDSLRWVRFSSAGSRSKSLVAGPLCKRYACLLGRRLKLLRNSGCFIICFTSESSSECLSPFPHGTATLSISHPVLRLRGRYPVPRGRFRHRRPTHYSNNVSWQSFYFLINLHRWGGSAGLAPGGPGRRQTLPSAPVPVTRRNRNTPAAIHPRRGGPTGLSPAVATRGGPPVSPPLRGALVLRMGGPERNPRWIPGDMAIPYPPRAPYGNTWFPGFHSRKFGLHRLHPACGQPCEPDRAVTEDRLVRSRSSLLTESLLMSFSRPTEIFHFGSVPIELWFEFLLWGNRQLAGPSGSPAGPRRRYFRWFVRPI